MDLAATIHAAAHSGNAEAQRQLEAYVEFAPEALEGCVAFIGTSGTDISSRFFSCSMLAAMARKSRMPPGPQWETILAQAGALVGVEDAAATQLFEALGAAAVRAGSEPAIALAARGAAGFKPSCLLLTCLASEVARLTVHAPNAAVAAPDSGAAGSVRQALRAQTGPLMEPVRAYLKACLTGGDSSGATLAMQCLVAWASGIGASFRALAGGIDAPEVDLATMLASVLDASTAAPVPLLDPTAELLEALFESSRAQGEPWSTAALEAFALSTAASAKASADAASLALARRAVAAVAQGSSDGNDDEAAGEAAGAAAVARLRACVVLVSADAARTRRGGPGSFALLDALAHGAGLPGSQWRPSRTSPGAPTCLRRASAVCLNYWGRADFRSSHTTTHPALVGGEAHQALLGRLLAPSVHAPPSVGAATAASDAGDDEDVDEDELSEWHSFREQDVADALSACHLALGSGTYLQAVLATLHAAVAASPATSPPHVDEGGDEMPAFALFAMRVVAIEASRRALLAQAPEATLMAATKRDPRLNNSNNNSSSGASSSAGSSSPADVARADARAADAALLEVVSMLLAASNPSHASGGVGSAGAGVEVVVVVASSADAWSVANSLVAGEACRLLAVLARWLMEAPSAQQAQLLPRALEFALGPALGPFPSSSSHGWVQQHRASNGSTNTSSNSSTAGSPEMFAGECVRTLCSRAAAMLATPAHLTNLSTALESATTQGVLTDPEARSACASGLSRILSQLSPPDATAALKAIAAPSLARLAAACSGGGAVGQHQQDAMAAAATTEVRVLAVFVRGTRAAVDPLRDLPTDPSSASAGGAASSTADRKSLLLEAEASPSVALLDDAWPVLHATAGTLTAAGPASTGGGSVTVLTAALVELLWFAAVLPLRRRTDVLAAACGLAGQLTPFAPAEVLKLAEEVAEQWGHRAEADAATAARLAAAAGGAGGGAGAGGLGLGPVNSEAVAARLPADSHGTTLAALAIPTLGAVAQSLTQALTNSSSTTTGTANHTAYASDLYVALLNAARAYVSHCPATLALCGKTAWEMLTDLAAAVASRPELEPAMAALRFLGLVVTLQEHLNAGTVEVCLMGSEDAATLTDSSSHAASTSPAPAALAARWQLAGPPALAAAERHGPSLVLRCLDLCCGGGPEPLVEPAARALHGLLSAKRSGVSAAARYACQQHLPRLLHARLPPSAQEVS